MRITLLIVLLTGCLKAKEGLDPSQCHDHLDNDSNGLMDCDEALCASMSSCRNSESDADADGDADGDADADVDTNVDDTGDWNPDTDGYDTGNSSTRSYEGGFTFLIQFQNELEGLNDTCNATGTINASPNVDGGDFSTSLVCAWEGAMASALGPELTFILAGSLGEGGTMDAPAIEFSTQWQGTTSSQRIQSSFSGESTLAGEYNYSYEGEFAFYRQ